MQTSSYQFKFEESDFCLCIFVVVGGLIGFGGSCPMTAFRYKGVIESSKDDDFCRLTWKLASPWFPQQKVDG